jgi:hypothetical protein
MDLSLSTPELRRRCFEIQSLASSSKKVRDKGYYPSPYTGLDEAEGYSPYLDLVSIPCDQNSLFAFNPSSNPRALLLSLHSSQVSPLSTTLPYLPSLEILCVARIPSLWSGLKALPMGILPHPSLTLQEAFPPTSMIGIHSWSEGCSDLRKLIPAWYWFCGG